MGIVEAWKKSREVCIIGVGQVRFNSPATKSAEDMSREAMLAALEDAGATIDDVQAGFSSRAGSITGNGQNMFGQLAQTGILIDNVEKACASATTALRLATWVVSAGFYDVVMCSGVETMNRGLLGAPPSQEAANYAQLLGINIMPGEYALRACRHMAEYGSTKEMFAQVSVKNHKNSSMNPYARYQQTMTLEQVLSSRMIAEPITLYQCSNNSDGAAAAVVCAREVAHKFRGKPVTIAGWASGTPSYSPVGVGGDVAEGFITRIAKQAYELAGIGPEDVRVMQCHDAFTSGEVFAIEETGICPTGEGARFIWEGKADINGKVAVNSDGGLIGRGHPVGATGLAQTGELVRQLRGQAGPRQITPAPRIALHHNVGVGGANVFIYKV